MSDETYAMNDKPPMVELTQLGDVNIFQTLACTNLSSFNETAFDSEVEGSLPNDQPFNITAQTSYGEFNLGLHVKDKALKVLDNRMRLLTAINEQLALQQRLPIKSLHWVNQVHDKQVYDIDQHTPSIYPVDADAMISRQDQLGLAIMTADCVPIVLYQPATGQIAAIHAGWQGLACGVIKATAERFNSVGQIKAWIGACISVDNYEVGYQVREKLLAGCIGNQSLSAAAINNFDELFCTAADVVTASSHAKSSYPKPDYLHKAVDNFADSAKVIVKNKTIDSLFVTERTTERTTEDKIKLDLPKLAAYQLQSAGINVGNDDYPCSYADQRYYSYRRQTHLQQSATGRMALIIVRSPAI